ncbi:Fungalysin metallopeptidase-domain-containing protein [Mycena rebaudengoi]|nr:Fungalysin metallopeptidase-domain-containing protein [Mycena rebaudengoi]
MHLDAQNIRLHFTQTFPPRGIHHPLYKRDDLEHSATAFVATQLAIKISFANAVANVAFKNGTAVSFGNSFVITTNIASSTPTVPINSAISTAKRALDAAYDNFPTTLEYLAQPENTVVLVHGIQVRNRKANAWYEAFVDVHTGKFISSIDLVSKSAVTSSPFSNSELKEIMRMCFFDAAMSETTLQSAAGLIFNYTQDPTLTPGLGGDRVLASLQNSLDFDNANFAAPPEPAIGQSGEMNMYLWDAFEPMRDGALSNDIVVHEMTHGITNRMTGGGTGRRLQIFESKGLGEGWSDAMADWTEQVGSPIVDLTLGSYVAGSPIRSRPYSTNSTAIFPYLSCGCRTEILPVADIGEIWANILHNVLAALVDAHGFSKTARTDPSGTEGNVVFLHLFIDALALQPCQPDFLQARDAIILADHNRYSGAHECLLWMVFASRGMGIAAEDYNDDFSVPAEC